MQPGVKNIKQVIKMLINRENLPSGIKKSKRWNGRIRG